MEPWKVLKNSYNAIKEMKKKKKQRKKMHHPNNPLINAFALSEIHRRLSNLIRLGVIVEADYNKARVKVRIGKNTTQGLPWLALAANKNAAWNPPAIGEQVVVLSPQGDYSQGVVLHGLYQTKFPAPNHNPKVQRQQYADGTYSDYDAERHEFKLSLVPEGTITLKVGESQLTINANAIELTAPQIRLQGAVEGITA